MTLTCKEVNIRFINHNFKQQRITVQELTGAKHLEVKIDAAFVTVMYMFEHDGIAKPMKVLVFNTEQVVEIHCENGVQTPPVMT